MDAVIECHACHFPMLNSDGQCPYCGSGPRTHAPLLQTREQRLLAAGFIVFAAIGVAAIVAALNA